jgi:haloacetate dehalogenase
MGSFFEGFQLVNVDVGTAKIRARVGGTGSPILFLHGHPQTHAMWHSVAPIIARAHKTVCADLPGYGQSSKHGASSDPPPYSKRGMAVDLLGFMKQLGFERFGVVGHDRGGRVAYRLALDHPDVVTRVAVLDIVPTFEVWRRMDKELAMAFYHWLFLAQPEPFPERLIAAAPEQFYFRGDRSRFPREALDDYLAAVANPTTIHAMCEDYRAGAGYDAEADALDFAAGRRLRCPLLALWAERDGVGRWFDVLSVWRRWCDGEVVGRSIGSGHFLAEESPEETGGALADFFTGW